MKEFFKTVNEQFEDWGKKCGETIYNAICKHPEITAIVTLFVLCYLFLFFGMDFYPLLDVDETRYAVMARDLAHSANYNILLLNSDAFLEKPPLYFWLVAASIKIFGAFNEISVRTPIALCASFTVFFTYFLGRKIISRRFGIYSALILLSSVFFLMLSHVAIIDMVLTTFITSALYCGILSQFVSEKNKKYCWWYFYLFIGVGMLAKGILAIAIPVIIMFAYLLCTKKLKDFFKPVNFLPGLVLFFIISFPWHYVMYEYFGFHFIKEYFLIHHFARFIDSAVVGRERPFLYFIPVFFVGFLPWSFTFIALIVDGYKKLAAKYKEIQGSIWNKITTILDAQTNEQKMVLFASIYFLVIFTLVSVSSTKLPTYILPAFPAAALLTGYYWYKSDAENKISDGISITTYIFSGMLIIAAFAATIAYCILPDNIAMQIANFRAMVTIGVYLLCMLLILRLRSKKALSVFATYLLTMIYIIAVAVLYIFNIIFNGGQNEIQYFASYAKEPGAQLVTFDYAVKPSAMITSEKHVNIILDPDYKKLDYLLKYDGPTYVIVKNENSLRTREQRHEIRKRLELISRGKKYTLFAKNHPRMGISKEAFEQFRKDFQKKNLTQKDGMERMNGEDIEEMEMSIDEFGPAGFMDIEEMDEFIPEDTMDANAHKHGQKGHHPHNSARPMPPLED